MSFKRIATISVIPHRKAIAQEIGRSERQTFYLLETETTAGAQSSALRFVVGMRAS